MKLQIEGEKTELDKGIVDVIGEPLSHIIRNAVDHGIEYPKKERPRENRKKVLLSSGRFTRATRLLSR